MVPFNPSLSWKFFDIEVDDCWISWNKEESSLKYLFLGPGLSDLDLSA